MSIRTLAARIAVAAALLAPALPAHAAPDDEAVTVRLAVATFKGTVTLKKGSTAGTASISAYLTDCTVAGLSGRVPFVNNCVFSFNTETAVISTKCTASWVHPSFLTFFEPYTGNPIILGYDPTVTNIVEGDGTGHGVSALPVTKVNYVIISLCGALDEDPETVATIAGSVTGAY